MGLDDVQSPTPDDGRASYHTCQVCRPACSRRGVVEQESSMFRRGMLERHAEDFEWYAAPGMKKHMSEAHAMAIMF